MGDHKAESDRVFGGSGVVGIESPVIGRLAIALASECKSTSDQYFPMYPHNPLLITARGFFLKSLA